jgi:hypothetical protein
MQGEDEVSIARNAEQIRLKNSKHNQIISSEDEFVSPSAEQPPSDSNDIDITTMHANEPNLLPGGDNANIIRTFRSIAQQTGQVTEIMKFPPIDHEAPIKYVCGNFRFFQIFPHFALTTYPFVIFCGNFRVFQIIPPFCSEYDITKNIFTNSYPWLFPGGIGDIYDMTRGKVSIKDWGRHLLRYYDGRFLEDSLFGLFLYNTVQRHSSNSEGNFFLASD